MKNKKILVIGIVIIIVVLVIKQFLAQREIAKTVTPTTAVKASTLYKGTSPCADCPGIAVELNLQRANKFDDYGTFTMKETYLERQVAPIDTTGRWTVDRGSAANPDATVYVINYENPAQIQYFLKVDDKTMRNLDSDKKELPAPYNYTLTTE